MSRIRVLVLPLAVLAAFACAPPAAELVAPPELIARQTLFGNPDKSSGARTP